MKYELYFKDFLKAIEEKLEEALPPDSQYPSVIHEAMRYAVFPGGKRFRPVLALAACEAAGGNFEEALIPAAAVELIHCYSLVHDDLPALDNDETRRQKPACHKRFGAAIAILAGDGLLSLAFQLLSRIQPAGKAVGILEELSTAAGTYGMIGGQVADLITKKEELNVPLVEFISIHKTGKLIKAGAVSGALAGGASKDALERVVKYGESVGLAFQFIDDLIDQDGSLQVIKAGEVRQKVRDLIAYGLRELRPLGSKTEKLNVIAGYLLKRLPRGNHVAVD